MIDVEKDGAVTTVILNRPQVRNALNNRMLEELADACTWLERHPDCRVAILRAARNFADALHHFVAFGDFAEYAVAVFQPRPRPPPY